MRSSPPSMMLISLLSLAAACNSSLAYYGPKGDKELPTDPTGITTPDPTPSTETTTSTTTPSTTDPTTDPTTTDPTTTDPTTTPTDTGRAAEPWNNGDPSSPPPYTAPPEQNIGFDCTDRGGVFADLDDDEVDVLSHEGTLEIRTLNSPVSGWYDLYDEELSHEEAGEWNESAMVRILNAANLSGLPVLDNCDGDWVTVDPDNLVDPGEDLFYMGTFWFEAGDNELQLEHLCPRVRAGRCTALEFLDDSDTTCASGDGNSAHLDGQRLCLVPLAL